MSEEQHLGISLFLASVVTLAFETVVFRVFTFLFGYHFVSFLLSLALLGYGMSGSLAGKVPLVVKKLSPFLLGWSFIVFFLGLGLFPFDPYEVLLRPSSLLILGFMLLMALSPFFLHGLIQIFSFERFPQFFSRFYGLNLWGSAVGVGVGLLSLTRFEETRALLLLALVGISGRVRMVWRVILLAVVIALFFSPLKMSLSPYSPSRLLREIPENELLRTYHTPLETLEVFSTPSSRVGWGLSVRFEGVPPSSFTLVFDHHALETFPREPSVPFLEALLLALPFRIGHPEKVLVVEGKGGMEVYLAHHCKSQRVDLVTSSFLFATFLRDFVPAFPAQVMVTSPRRYLQRKKEFYDCITVQVPVGRASVLPGSFSFVEDFLFTREGIRALFSALRDGGVLVFSLFLQNPPSLLPKLTKLLASALGSEALLSRLAVVKNLDFALFLLKRDPWERDTIAAFQEEVKRWCFDVIYYPGGEEGEFEQVFQTGQRYYRALREALREGDFQSPFDLRPPRDHRPYFRNFFRFGQLGETWRHLGKRWLPFGGAGFLLFVAIFALVVCFSAVALLLPLQGLGRRGTSSRRRAFLLSALSTGVGFMFLEMTLFARLSLVVDLPLYTFSLLLVVLLLGSGWGSLRVQRGFPEGALRRYAFFHLVAMGGYFVFLELFGNELFLLLPLLPLAYASGMPFPLLSERVRREEP
ncbi:MAG: hypothetical protein ACP5Q4_05645, partial [Candidatus Caldatribacteriaceae bacterium]